MDFFKLERIFIVFFLLLIGYGMMELSFVCYMILFENNKYGLVGLLLLNL